MNLVQVLQQLLIMHDDTKQRIGYNVYTLECIVKLEKKFGALEATDIMQRDAAIELDKALRDKLTAVDYLMGRIVGDLLLQ